MEKVEGHMNSADFAAKGGTGLLGLCKSLRSRCEEVLRREGGRLPKSGAILAPTTLEQMPSLDMYRLMWFSGNERKYQHGGHRATY